MSTEDEMNIAGATSSAAYPASFKMGGNSMDDNNSRKTKSINVKTNESERVRNQSLSKWNRDDIEQKVSAQQPQKSRFIDAPVKTITLDYPFKPLGAISMVKSPLTSSQIPTTIGKSLTLKPGLSSQNLTIISKAAKLINRKNNPIPKPSKISLQFSSIIPHNTSTQSGTPLPILSSSSVITKSPLIAQSTTIDSSSSTVQTSQTSLLLPIQSSNIAHNSITTTETVTTTPSSTIITNKKMYDCFVTTKSTSVASASTASTVLPSSRILLTKPSVVVKRSDTEQIISDNPKKLSSDSDVLIVNLAAITSADKNANKLPTRNFTPASSKTTNISTLIIHQSDLGMPIQIRQEAPLSGCSRGGNNGVKHASIVTTSTTIPPIATNSTISVETSKNYISTALEQPLPQQQQPKKFEQFKINVNNIPADKRQSIIMPASAKKTSNIPGLHQIPKDTIVKKISSKKCGSEFDIPKLSIPKILVAVSEECSSATVGDDALNRTEPTTITIIPKDGEAIAFRGKTQKIIDTNREALASGNIPIFIPSTNYGNEVNVSNNFVNAQLSGNKEIVTSEINPIIAGIKPEVISKKALTAEASEISSAIIGISSEISGIVLGAAGIEAGSAPENISGSAKVAPGAVDAALLTGGTRLLSQESVTTSVVKNKPKMFSLQFPLGNKGQVMKMLDNLKNVKIETIQSSASANVNIVKQTTKHNSGIDINCGAFESNVQIGSSCLISSSGTTDNGSIISRSGTTFNNSLICSSTIIDSSVTNCGIDTIDSCCNIDSSTITCSSGNIFNSDLSSKKHIVTGKFDPSIKDTLIAEYHALENQKDDGGMTKLKNKMFEHVNRNPRLMNRSKSVITIITDDIKEKRRYNNFRTVRRLPSAPAAHIDAIEVTAKLQKIPTISSELTVDRLQKQKQKSDCQPLRVENALNINAMFNILFDSLECTEKIDESEKSKSVSPIEKPAVKQEPMLKQRTVIASVTDDEKKQQQQEEIHFKWHRNDPWAYIKWKQGIGYLSNSRVHFKRNEFGLIELLNTTNNLTTGLAIAIDEQFQNILNVRNCPTGSTTSWMDDENKPYICKNCYGNSERDLCTIECSVLYNAKHNRLKLRTNRPRFYRIRGVGGRNSNGIGSTKTRTAITTSIINSSSSGSTRSSCSGSSTSSFSSTYSNINTNNKKNKSIKTQTFSWDQYLDITNGIPAPDHLFAHPFPVGFNHFEVGMKLEAIDPENASLFCVCTIVDIKGYRIKLHFDGYDRRYHFWRNVDSIDIFPAGWCAKNSKQLQPPCGYSGDVFDWQIYTARMESLLAPRVYFTHLNAKGFLNQIKIGMKLEAFDVQGNAQRELRVATVADFLYTRLLIRFDGLDELHDYWADISSPRIHPIDWHKMVGVILLPPPNYSMTNFIWLEYLAANHCESVPAHVFSLRSPIDFKIGMHLEVVDRMVPALIRPATIVDIYRYEIKVLYDGWPLSYAYWIEDDSTDIHPIKWCEKTSHPIEFPTVFSLPTFKSSCGVTGCRELGNAKNPNVDFHYNLSECPYESRNWIVKKDTNRMSAYFKEKKLNTQGNHQSRSILKDHLKRIKMECTDQATTTPTRSLPLVNYSLQIDGIQRIRTVEKNQLIVELPTQIKQEKPDYLDDNDVENKSNLMNYNYELERRIDQTRIILDRYGPRIQETYRLWKQNSATLNLLTEKHLLQCHQNPNPLQWTIDDVCNFISCLNKNVRLPEIFREQKIDGIAFLCLTQDDLQYRLHLRIGPSIKIYNQIITLREEVAVKYLPR